MTNNIYEILQYDIGTYVKSIDKSELDGKNSLVIRWTVKKNGVSINNAQEVFFTKVPSNLGKGFLYYFICPVTNLRCKKIYYNQYIDYYVSRKGFKQLGHVIQYPSQALKGKYLLFHQYRTTNKKYDRYQRLCLHRKGYKGKMTKSFRQLQKNSRKLSLLDNKILDVLANTLDKEVADALDVSTKVITGPAADREIRKIEKEILKEMQQENDLFF